MKIVLNGESREVPEGLTVAGLLVHLAIASGRVAIERNLDILPREQWESTHVAPGDRFEIVHFVGGGRSAGIAGQRCADRRRPGFQVRLP